MSRLINRSLLGAAGGGSYETESVAYFSKLDLAGYPLDSAKKTWVDNRVKNLKGISAGSITTGYNIWPYLKSLVFGPQNAGAGTTVYAVIGEDSTTSTFEPNGHFKGGSFTLSNPIRISTGYEGFGVVCNGITRLSGGSFDRILYFKDAANVLATNFVINFKSGLLNTRAPGDGTAPSPQVVDQKAALMFAVRDLTGLSSSIPSYRRIDQDDVTTLSGLHGTMFGLPSNVMESAVLWEVGTTWFEFNNVLVYHNIELDETIMGTLNNIMNAVL